VGPPNGLQGFWQSSSLLIRPVVSLDASSGMYGGVTTRPVTQHWAWSPVTS